MSSQATFKVEGTGSGFSVTEFSGPTGSSYYMEDGFIYFETVDDYYNVTGLVTSSYLVGTTAFPSLSIGVPTSKKTRFALLTTNGTGFNALGLGNYANITISLN